MADGGVLDQPAPAADALIDPLVLLPDLTLVTRLPPALALGHGLLPWREVEGEAVVLCADPHAALPHLGALAGALGPVRLAHAARPALTRALALAVGRPLVAAAERRLPDGASCRSLPWGRLKAWAALSGAGLLAALWAAPLATLAVAALLASLGLLLGAGLKLAALSATLRREPPEEGADVVPARLPVVTLLVPLYREAPVAGHLLARLDVLDYPRTLLDVCLLVEDDDAPTRAALEGAWLPPWARVVEVPEGALRTKPRALNYGLALARGGIVGLYDAEDRPAPDHLRQVVRAFARRGPAVACLQGALDYFDADRNWLARCFALEYATWFRVMLPGLERLGLVVPLGGTTLFLRREAIEAVGGWDAHNVTEDADLGVRLARAGLRTAMIPIVTMEEANARAWPWVRQRSRWLKGYALTYAVHMRAPGRLWRDLGPRAFLAFQVQFAGTLLQFALAPLLWSFCLVPLGLPHPLAPLLPSWLLVALSILFLASQVLDVGLAALGARRAGRPLLALWAPTMQLYFPLATVAFYRALWQVARRPFWWDKTAHGVEVQPLTRGGVGRSAFGRSRSPRRPTGRP